MNSQDISRYGEKGELYCRRAVWTDVATFFLLNILLHATTVMSAPGSSRLQMIQRTTLSILAPFSGLSLAIQTIVCSRSKRKNEVDEAHRARALCMLVPLRYWKGFEFKGELHGQFPDIRRTRLTRFTDLFDFSSSKTRPADLDPEMVELLSEPCKPIAVPTYFTVRPTRNSEYGETKLARNYNVVKGCAAILQICYGSFELYDSRRIQFKKYGYATYSFVVVPYILMSFVNLIATLCEPEYPSQYLVLYGGEDADSGIVIGPSIQENGPNDNSEQKNGTWIKSVQKNINGAVGYAYGPLDPSWEDIQGLVKWKERIRTRYITYSMCLATVPIPYLIIYAITGFEQGQSTRWERLWIMLSIVLGQAGWIIPGVLNISLRALKPDARNPAIYPTSVVFVGLKDATGKYFKWWVYTYGLVLGAAIMYSFSVVGSMMLHDDICTRL